MPGRARPYRARVDYVDIATGFVTTFLGAFLAFGLENLRERRRLQEWVRQHLAHLRIGVRRDLAAPAQIHRLLAEQTSACHAWIAASGPEDMSEKLWTQIAVVMVASAPDFSAILRSEAVTVLPPPLGAALSETEMAGMIVEKHTAALIAHREYVMPLWFERTVPLTPADARRVVALQDTIKDLDQAIHALYQPLQRMINEIDRWLGGPERGVPAPDPASASA